MPLVRKTKLSLTFAAAFAVSIAQCQMAQAEDWGQPLTADAAEVWSGAFSGGTRSFQLAYGREFGGVFLGGSVAAGQTGLLTRAVQADETHQLRLQAGYEFGQAAGFVTFGGVQAEAAGGARQGPVIGLGMRVSLNRALQLTGELLHHEAGPKDGSASPRGETLSLSAAFRF
ncbi:hypothetical protein [Leisingera thetidis]|uniref:hypothetical protein n=1 Tax=Leisingera thetidis TaxID=2930199 RepID=UPI0021F6D533|nr:hypothetical protein [Leisingera thetidis]